MALLEVRNLQVNYGPIQAVKGIDLDVALRNIVTERDPMLRKVSRPVEKFDRRLES